MINEYISGSDAMRLVSNRNVMNAMDVLEEVMIDRYKKMYATTGKCRDTAVITELFIIAALFKGCMHT